MSRRTNELVFGFLASAAIAVIGGWLKSFPMLAMGAVLAGMFIGKLDAYAEREASREGGDA